MLHWSVITILDCASHMEDARMVIWLSRIGAATYLAIPLTLSPTHGIMPPV